MITQPTTTDSRLSWSAVRSALRPLGVTLRSTVDGEYVIRVRGSAAGEGYHTTSPADALATGRAMAAQVRGAASDQAASVAAHLVATLIDLD